MRGSGLAAAALCSMVVLACGEPAPPQVPEPIRAQPPVSSAGGPAPQAETASDPEFDREIADMLRQVTRVRGLPVKTDVHGARLGRAEVIQLIMTKTQKELPKGVLEAQGELLRGMGLIRPDYDFVGGIYGLIQENLAGFYDQHADKMFILDDLAESSVAETLAHELVHALQDQHFDLAKMLEYRPGASDRVTASHALAEGDAMSAMFDLTLGDARKISAKTLRVAMVASVAFSGSGGQTPRVLQASLIAPYIDGFRFVQELRDRGGWGAVNAAYRRPPISTEQLLHVDKYLAAEQPLTVPTPVLPENFVLQDQDVLGEQGARMIFEQWATNKQAAAGATGWGGDRFAVGKKTVPSGAQWAGAWRVRFDSAQDAMDAEELLRKHHKSRCEARADLGPLAWQRKGVDVALVVGPFHKANDGTLTSAASCADAHAWIQRLL